MKKIQLKPTCAKQTVVAILVKDDKYYIGSNWCSLPQKVCPRQNSKSGEDYEYCEQICGQDAHAEVDVITQAGANAKGSTLFLLGHSYCCNDCQQAMTSAGVKEIVIVDNLKIGVNK